MSIIHYQMLNRKLHRNGMSVDSAPLTEFDNMLVAMTVLIVIVPILCLIKF